MIRYRFYPGNPGVTLFDAICDMDNLRLAHQNASRGKAFYKEVKMVNSNPDYYLKQILVQNRKKNNDNLHFLLGNISLRR